MIHDYKSRHKQGITRRQIQCQFTGIKTITRPPKLTTIRRVRETFSKIGKSVWFSCSYMQNPIYTGYKLAKGSAGSGGGDTRRLASNIMKKAKHLPGFKRDKLEVIPESKLRNRLFSYY